jgi:hypothetical protein
VFATFPLRPVLRLGRNMKVTAFGVARLHDGVSGSATLTRSLSLCMSASAGLRRLSCRSRCSAGGHWL